MRETVVGILVAVREEFGPIHRRITDATIVRDRFPAAAAGRIGGCSVVLLRAGMGRERAVAAAARLLQNHHVTHAIIAGFGAGLNAEVRPGDVVVVSHVLDQCRPSWIGKPDACWLSAVEAPAPSRFRRTAGPLVTGGKIATTPTDKRALAAEYPEAVALDMETAATAALLGEHGLPWIAIRAITDGIGDCFPMDFGALTDPATGEVRRSAVVREALAHPSLMPGLFRLGTRSSRAARNLAAVVEEYVHQAPGG